MYIFVDESGTFTPSPARNSWCVVAAYAAPEHARRKLEHVVAKIRSINRGRETKLRDMTEDQYLAFLWDLRQIDGLAFAVAVDTGCHSAEAVKHHRDGQVEKVLEHQDKMRFAGGRQAVGELARMLGAVPPQLYLQLVAQVVLLYEVIQWSTFYYAQRHPSALGNFRWRIDQKEKCETRYETAFYRLLPALLQSKSLDEPLLMLKGADYSHYAKFLFSDGAAPSFLKDDYGIAVESPGDIGKLIREDFKFVDSNASPGVQVADLVSAGVFRLLRQRFDQCESVAQALGGLFASPPKKSHCIRIVTLDQEGQLDAKVAHLVRLVDRSSKPILISRG